MEAQREGACQVVWESGRAAPKMWAWMLGPGAHRPLLLGALGSALGTDSTWELGNP